MKYTAYFATRIENNSSTAIANIVKDNSELDMSSISPIISGLSHHNAQILTFKHVSATTNRFTFHECHKDSMMWKKSQTHTSLHYKLLQNSIIHQLYT